ncbi:hypothetical protein [Jiangella rhizosphaerae]|uniref:Uncharacterized protein n=1 Tax=Jiangella rhizosphaerae TaxID=2293569 RepID=A0A418KPA7_9ACTN|nr:hypothetical protein [Jiangella rhizosphaerae]RIQ21274.1 hypothetical protein DY240_15745 [Jiangella rhizosphaerae]
MAAMTTGAGITREQYDTIMRLAREYADGEARLCSGLPLKRRRPAEAHDELNTFVAGLVGWTQPAVTP